MLSINELSQKTGLKVSFIRKCLNQMKPILSSYLQRGRDNMLLFDSNAVVIFDKIQQLKQQNLTLPEIGKQLKNIQLQTKQSNQTNGSEVLQTASKAQVNYEDSKLFNKLFEVLKQSEEKSQRILELERINQGLQGTLKLLPEGKTPEQIREKWEQEQKRKQDIVRITTELKNISILSFRKRKRLIKKLEELLG